MIGQLKTQHSKLKIWQCYWRPAIGNRIVKVVPFPGSLSTVIDP
jgi:hypothetical protein